MFVFVTPNTGHRRTDAACTEIEIEIENDLSSSLGFGSVLRPRSSSDSCAYGSAHFIFGIYTPHAPGESLGPILCRVELPTQRALRAARDVLHPMAREVLPPFDVFVSTPPPRLQSSFHVATNAASFEEVLARAGSSTSQARIRSASGAGAGHWLQTSPILSSLRFPAPLFVTALRLRLDLPHPCLTTYEACSCGHALNPLGTHLLRYAREGEHTASHDSVRNAI